MIEPAMNEEISSLRNDRIEFAKRHAEWYRRKKKSKQRFSVVFRSAALMLGSIGGVWPIIVPRAAEDQYVGYVFIAISGALILADRMFGISSSWMRYMIAALEIEERLELFVLDMDALAVREAQSSPVAFDLARQFTSDICAIVKGETSRWLADFEAGLAEVRAKYGGDSKSTR